MGGRNGAKSFALACNSRADTILAGLRLRKADLPQDLSKNCPKNCPKTGAK
jgi:hypothetical protein